MTYNVCDKCGGYNSVRRELSLMSDVRAPLERKWVSIDLCETCLQELVKIIESFRQVTAMEPIMKERHESETL